jgi:hypothetical protein
MKHVLIFWQVVVAATLLWPTPLCSQGPPGGVREKMYAAILQYMEAEVRENLCGKMEGLCGRNTKRWPSPKLYGKSIPNSPWSCIDDILRANGVPVSFESRAGLPGPHDSLYDSITSSYSEYQRQAVDFSQMREMEWQEGREGTVVRVSDVYKNTVLAIRDLWCKRIGYFGKGTKAVRYFVFDDEGNIVKVYQGKGNWD